MKNMEFMRKVLLNATKEEPLDVHIHKNPGDDAVEVSICGSCINLIASAICLVDKVSNDVVGDLQMLFAMKGAINDAIEKAVMKHIVDGATDEKPESKPDKSLDPELASEIFGKIFGN